MSHPEVSRFSGRIHWTWGTSSEQRSAYWERRGEELPQGSPVSGHGRFADTVLRGRFSSVPQCHRLRSRFPFRARPSGLQLKMKIRFPLEGSSEDPRPTPRG